MADLIKDAQALIASFKTIKTDPFTFVADFGQLLTDVAATFGKHVVAGIEGLPGEQKSLVSAVETADVPDLSDLADATPHLVGGPISDVMLAIQVLAAVKQAAPEVWAFLRPILSHLHA